MSSEEQSDPEESSTNSTNAAENAPTTSRVADFEPHSPEGLSLLISHIDNEDVDGVSEWCEQWDNIPLYIQTKIMCVAAKRGSVDIIETLVQHGFSPNHLEPNEEDEKPLVPILEAAQAGHLDVVQKLVEDFGVQVDERHSSGMTALMVAVRNLDTSLVKYLLTKGADPNFIYHPPGESRVSPLFAAVLVCSTECACLLLDSGADVNMPISFAGSFINMAVIFGSLDMVKLFHERGAKLDVVSDDGEGIMHQALVPRPDVNIIRYLIENNASLDVVSDKGYSPLAYAIKFARNCEKVLEWLPILLDAGYRPTRQDYNAIRENSFLNKDDFTKIMNMTEKYLSVPRTLQHLCRYRIRRLLGIRLSEKIECLPLPSALKQYLEHL